MQFTISVAAAIVAFASYTFASPLEARANSLQDWQVTSVGSGTPSGRPGTYPWGSIIAGVTDPNEINLGPAKSDGSNVTVPAGSKGTNCKAQYFTKKAETPLGRTWPCDPVDSGYWTMEVLAGSDGKFSSENFNLKFTHVADVLYQGSEYTASYQAEGNFAVGKNMGGTCGGSGVCSWGLKQDSTPFPIKPKKV